MKKIYSLLIIIMIFITACQPTPEEKVVVGKGEDQIEAIIDKAIDTQAPTDEAEEPQLISLQYDVPERLEYTMDSDIEGAAMKIRVNADVVLPQYTLPLVTVRPRDISYEQVMSIVGLLKKDRLIYHSQYAERIALKKDIQHRIDTYLWEAAVSENEDSKSHYQSKVKDLYKEIELAPETYADADILPEESAPDITFVDGDGTMRTEPAPEGMFFLTEDYIGPFEFTQENFDDESYSLLLGEGFDADTLVVNADPDSDWYQQIRFTHTIFDGVMGKSIRSKHIEGLMDGFAFTSDQAIAIADDYAKAIDGDLVLSDVAEAIHTDFSKDDNPSYPFGYTLYYTRQYYGVNANYAEKFTWNKDLLQATGESQQYQKPYPQEALIITVGEEGLQKIEYTSPLEVVETVANNVELLPFDKIKEKFEQYIVLNSYGEDSTIYLNIERIQLGLMRIAQPGSEEYLIVPVWDFYGSSILSSDRADYSDEEYWEKISHFYGRSFLTINAVNGSIIDREYGY